MRRAIKAVAVGAMLAASNASGQENGPVIVPEELQRLAQEFPIAERLGIDWSSASVEDTGRYVGFLAAVNDVAETVASMNNREVPTKPDFFASLAAFCLFPPNKPPLVEEYWPRTYSAYFDAETRAALDDAVGELTAELPSYFATDTTAATMQEAFPVEQEAYLSEVLDLTELPE